MRRSVRLSVGFGLLATASIAGAHEAEPSRYNYRDDVRPIFVEHCASCHRPGGVGPMSLLEYQEAVPWANAIKMQLLQQTMPPWLPAEGVGVARFLHERSLTAEEVDIVVDWVVGQTPEGEPLGREELEHPESPPGPLEKAEMVLEPEAPVVLTEDEFEKIACVVYPLGLEESRVAVAFTVAPELSAILRRATIFRGDICDDATPLATWLPDQRAVTFPAGSGVSLARGDSLAVELAYVKGWEDDGKRLEDSTRLGVTFGAEASSLDLVEIEGSGYSITGDRELLALYAEPYVSEEAAEPLRVEAVLPNGEHRALLVIESYDPAWRESYVLDQPLVLPGGSEVRVSRPGVWMHLSRETLRPASGSP